MYDSIKLSKKRNNENKITKNNPLNLRRTLRRVVYLYINKMGERRLINEANSLIKEFLQNQNNYSNQRREYEKSF